MTKKLDCDTLESQSPKDTQADRALKIALTALDALDVLDVKADQARKTALDALDVLDVKVARDVRMAREVLPKLTRNEIIKRLQKKI
jgi:hypothetical protein